MKTIILGENACTTCDLCKRRVAKYRTTLGDMELNHCVLCHVENKDLFESRWIERTCFSSDCNKKFKARNKFIRVCPTCKALPRWRHLSGGATWYQ